MTCGVGCSLQGGKINPAADPRKMRRIIAEDPEWFVSELAACATVVSRASFTRE